MTARRWSRMIGRRVMAPLAMVSVLGSASEAVAAPIKVACVGEQTTHSDQFPSTGVGEYPWMLQMQLGTGYDVRNFGDCCATILQGYPKQPETHPYLMGGLFAPSTAFAPDIVVIGSWGKHDTEIANSLYSGVLDATKLQSDYDALVTSYLNLASKPKVFVSLPVPIPKGAPQGVTTNVILPSIRAVAGKYNLPIVDLYASFLNHPELYKDDTHVSNDGGLHKIADLVYAALIAAGDAGASGSNDAAAPGANDASTDAGAPAADAGDGAGSTTGGAGSSGTSSSGAGGSGSAGTSGSVAGVGGTASTSASTGAAGASNPAVPADADSGCAVVATTSNSGCVRAWTALLMGAALVARRRRSPRFAHSSITSVGPGARRR